MKKHEFMTRLTNALHSPSSVCSASLRSQLPPGKPGVLPRQYGTRKNCGESVLPCKFCMQGVFTAAIQRQLLTNLMFRNRRRVP